MAGIRWLVALVIGVVLCSLAVRAAAAERVIERTRDAEAGRARVERGPL